MGTVARQEKLGDSSSTISFESYEDFLDYQKKEREQDALDVPRSEYRISLSSQEYYYLSCILGHLVPAGEISKSLLDKVGLDDLDCEDFDKVILSDTQIKLVEGK